MRVFYSFTIALSIIACVLFLTVFNYNSNVILYHLIMVGVVHMLLFLLSYFVYRLIKHPYKKPIFHTINFLFLFFYIQFYISITSSNLFWNKTITLPIIKNYLTTFSEFLSIIPVNQWIIISLLAIDIILCVLLYIFFAPRLAKSFNKLVFERENSIFKKLLVASAAGVIVALLFYKQIGDAKKTMHLAEEPILQFAFGAMWGDKNTLAFDKQRYLNGLKDQGCTDSIQPYSGKEKNFIIILMDGLRQDHLPMYGYHRNTTPFLDSLYRLNKIHLVKNAFSTSTGTIGGVSGLFFSKGWNEFGFNGLSLMKFLKKSGFTTYAFLTGFHRDWYGLSALYRGSCDYYYESSTNPKVQLDDDLITLNELTKTDFNNNSFIYLHLLSTHHIGKKNPPFKKFTPDKISFGVDEKTALTNNYDNGILQSDYVIRKVFEKLKGENMLDNSTVFILSDHGDLFGEDNEWGHGGSIHPSLLSIPLLVYDQNLEWYQNNEAASLKDIAPTIADRLNQKIPFCWEGVSLHNPIKNFQLEVNTAEPNDYPSGLLSYQNGTYSLKIRNSKKEVKKLAVKTNGSWVVKGIK